MCRGILCSDKLEDFIVRLNNVFNDAYKNSDKVEKIEFEQKCNRFDPMEDENGTHHDAYLNMQIFLRVKLYSKNRPEARVIINDMISIRDKSKKQENIEELGSRVYDKFIHGVIFETMNLFEIIDELSKEDTMRS